MFLALSFIKEIPGLNANSVDLDQTPISVDSDLGLHCLSMSLLWDSGRKGIKGNRYTFKGVNSFKYILLPSERRSTLEGHNLLPLRAICALLEWTYFQKGL